MMSLRTSFQSASEFIRNFWVGHTSEPRAIKYDPRVDEERQPFTIARSLHYQLRSFAFGDRNFLRLYIEGDAINRSQTISSISSPVSISVNNRTIQLGSFTANKADQKIHDFNHGHPLSEILKNVEITDPLLEKLIKAEGKYCYLQRFPDGHYDIFPEDKNEAGRCMKLRDFGALAL